MSGIAALALAKKKANPMKLHERIVEGKLKKFKDDSCLLRQMYIRDDDDHNRAAAAAEHRLNWREYRHPALRPLGTGREFGFTGRVKWEGQPDGWPFYCTPS